MESVWTGQPSYWKDAPVYGITAFLGLVAFGINYEWSLPLLESGALILAGVVMVALVAFLRTHFERYQITQDAVIRRRDGPFRSVDQYRVDQLRCLTVRHPFFYLGTRTGDVEFQPTHDRRDPLTFHALDEQDIKSIKRRMPIPVKKQRYFPRG